MHEMRSREELDRIGSDWQAHCQIAARLWNVLYGTFSMISCLNPTLGNPGHGFARFALILLENLSF
jgi:hypothetical protein